ncbi:MAG: hypothetical protein PVI31_15555, partial [Gemmatimonadota bacterium]
MVLHAERGRPWRHAVRLRHGRSHGCRPRLPGTGARRVHRGPGRRRGHGRTGDRSARRTRARRRPGRRERAAVRRPGASDRAGEWVAAPGARHGGGGGQVR